MNIGRLPARHIIYPARYFDASPTWYTWNKLTAADVHALREEPGFEGQNVYFHLNHPIRFVRLVGLIVAIETISSYFSLLTLDDGSGACIEIKINHRKMQAGDEAEYPSNTNVDNLDVLMHLGLPTILVDKQPIDIGTVVKVRCTISVYRRTRQLELKKTLVVKDTNAEAAAWKEVAEYKRDVLARPWVLTTSDQDRIDRETRKEELRLREKSKRRVRYEAKMAEKRREHEERVARRNAQCEQFYNAGALPGSEAIKPPWG